MIWCVNTILYKNTCLILMEIKNWNANSAHIINKHYYCKQNFTVQRLETCSNKIAVCMNAASEITFTLSRVSYNSVSSVSGLLYSGFNQHGFTIRASSVWSTSEVTSLSSGSTYAPACAITASMPVISLQLQCALKHAEELYWNWYIVK